tara:strand:+ start:28044 stop:28499 length:456 start_codon:yes stop_codon:yes gene_type:complete
VIKHYFTAVLIFLCSTVFSQQTQLAKGEKTNGSPVFDSCVGAEFVDFCTQLKLKEYIKDNLIYPQSELKRTEIVRVLVLFTIERDGSVRRAEVTIGVNDEFDNEAIRVIKSIPHFLPVTIGDEITRHKVSYFVEFTPPEKGRKRKKKKKED